MVEKETEIDIQKHHLVPRHSILSENEKAELLQKYKILPIQLPKISATDPAVKAVGAKVGDILKIERKSLTAGSTEYFRFVVKIAAEKTK